MKGTRNIGLIAIAVILLIFVAWGCGGYNSLVQKDEDVKTSWANVQGAYQRRADLIPNLVNTVRSEATFEQETLIKTIEARYKNLGSIKIDPENLNNETFQKFQQAQGEVNSSLSRLLVTVERYPELKANANFQNLQAQLEGTENRIKVSRNDFNGSVQHYNQVIRRFPNNIFAGMMNFKQRGYFQGAAGSENAPQVQF